MKTLLLAFILLLSAQSFAKGGIDAGDCSTDASSKVFRLHQILQVISIGHAFHIERTEIGAETCKQLEDGLAAKILNYDVSADPRLQMD